MPNIGTLLGGGNHFIGATQDRGIMGGKIGAPRDVEDLLILLFILADRLIARIADDLEFDFQNLLRC